MGVLGERIKARDVAVGILLSLSLGLGLLFLHFYTAYATQVTALLFGNILGVDGRTAWYLFALGLVSLLALAAISRPLLFASLQPELAEAKGVSLSFVSLLFLAALLIAPLITVFATALEKGIHAYLAAFDDPNTLSAIRLTLTTAAVVVPLNTIFGLAAAWCIAKFEFRGKNFLLTLIDLPFSMSPVVSGLVWVLLFGAQGWFGTWLIDHGADRRDVACQRSDGVTSSPGGDPWSSQPPSTRSTLPSR